MLRATPTFGVAAQPSEEVAARVLDEHLGRGCTGDTNAQVGWLETEAAWYGDVAYSSMPVTPSFHTLMSLFPPMNGLMFGLFGLDQKPR
jgi:hypothetical protein